MTTNGLGRICEFAVKSGAAGRREAGPEGGARQVIRERIAQNHPLDWM
jgi:hypothetical protein